MDIKLEPTSDVIRPYKAVPPPQTEEVLITGCLTGNKVFRGNDFITACVPGQGCLFFIL